VILFLLSQATKCVGAFGLLQAGVER
jgi:hypothetical protein